jgi:hypothetical protein
MDVAIATVDELFRAADAVESGGPRQRPSAASSAKIVSEVPPRVAVIKLVGSHVLTEQRLVLDVRLVRINGPQIIAVSAHGNVTATQHPGGGRQRQQGADQSATIYTSIMRWFTHRRSFSLR